MAETSLRILLVEDEPAHAEAIRRAFRAAGPGVVIRVAGTLREYRELAAAGPPDIAIMDLKLPDGQAVEVLTSPPEDGPFPILVISSYGDEQVAVKAMKAGALDYVVKSSDGFAAMPRTAERALREWQLRQERKRAEEALRRTEENFRRSLDESPLGVRIVTAEGETIYANRAILDIYGFSSLEELRTTPLEKRYTAESYAEFKKRYEGRQQGEDSPSEYEVSIVRKNGEVRHLQVSRKELLWNGKKQYQTIYRDITERKQIEHILRIQRDLALELSSTRDLDEALQMCLDTALQASGMDCGGIYLIDQATGALDLICHRNLPPSFIKSVSHYGADSASVRLLQQGKPVYTRHSDLAVPLDKAEQAEKLRVLAVIPVNFKNTVIACMNISSHAFDEIPDRAKQALETISSQIGRAITRIKAEEDLKRAEEALRESEARYRTLFDESLDGICLADAETGLIIDCNQALAALVGRERAELIGQSQTILHPPYNDQMATSPTFRQHLVHKEGHTLETQVVTSAGIIREVEIKANQLNFQGRKMLQGVFRDITERKRAEEVLRESEEKWRSLVSTLPDYVSLLDREGRFLFLNHYAEGFTGKDVIGSSVYQYLSIESKEIFEKKIAECQNTGKIQRFEHTAMGDHGIMREYEDYLVPILEKNKATSTLVISRDITERKRAEGTVRKSEEKYRGLTENVNLGIYRNTVGPEGKFIEANPAIIGMFGYKSKEEFLAINVLELYQNADGRNKFNDKMLNEGFVRGKELWLKKKDGSPFICSVSAVAVKDEQGHVKYYDGIIEDISERKRAEEALRASLREKEVLLREVHHRVKNNMQVISSLFNLQAGHTTNEECRGILKEGQTRIRSMSLVHEKLYQSRDLSKIDFTDYIQSLAVHLFHSYLVKPDRVRLETDFEDVSLDINSAVPCGLILNELISNALKHAFPEGRTGVIKIGLRRGPGGAVELRVADDGVGLPEGLDFRKAESFGLQIVNLLVDQLEATIEIDRTKGTSFTVTFRELKYASRI